MDDFGDLGKSLQWQEERPWSHQSAGSVGFEDQQGQAQNVAEDILRRHQRSQQPESRRICAMLKAILAALEQEGLEAKPAALFAALVLALEGTMKDQAGNAPVNDQAAIMYLLEQAASSMSRAAVRLKFSRSVQVVCKVLEGRLGDEKPSSQALKYGVGCLATLVCGHDPAHFPTAAVPFSFLVNFMTDARPKVRKRAYSGLSQVFLAMQSGNSLQPASQVVANFVEKTIEDLVAATSSKQSKNKKEYAEKLQGATTVTFHVLGGLKDIIAFLDPKEALRVVSALDKLLMFKEALLAHHASLVLERFFQSHHLSSSMKPEVLMALLQQLVEKMLGIEDLMADADIASSTMGMLFSGFRSLNQLDNSLCLQCIPQLFHQCLHYFRRKDSEAFRVKVSNVLSDLMELCITEAAVEKAHRYAQKSKSNKEHPVLSIIAGVEAMLTVPYQDSWNVAFQLISKLTLLVGDKHSSLLKSILQEVGLLAAGPENEWTDAIQECIGNAVRALGPVAVLEAIPLQIEDAVEKGSEANSWLVYILQKNTYGASLEFWARDLLPIARKVGEYARTMAEGHDVERAVLMAALENQIWQTLPAFCRWSSDTSTGFQYLAKSLGLALQNRDDLRNYICNAIACIVKQNRSIIKESRDTKNLLENQSVSDEGDFDFEDSFPIPDFYNEDFARANLEAIAGYAKNFLPLLFNIFVSSKPSERGQVHAAITAFGMITDADTLDAFYKNILKRMASSLQSIQAEGDKSMRDASIEQQAMLMDIAAALVPGLKKSSLQSLLNITNVSIVYKDTSIQKKSYKLLFCLLKRAEEFDSKQINGIQESLSNAQASCYAPAKKNRLLCLRSMIAIIDSRIEDKEKDQDMMTSMVTEIVMCTKEKNAKTHKVALDLLADIASSFKGLETVDEGPLLQAGPLGFINVVAGGLVASHPHMISATILSLTRLVYQFADILETEVITEVERAVSSLLKTKSREVVKSVLGFMNMYVTTIDSASLHLQLPQVIESLLIWANDTKNRFRLKIRYILEKIIRILGLEEVTRYIPEEHLPLIRYIRKMKSQEKRKRDGSVSGYTMKTGYTAGKNTTWTYMEDEEDDHVTHSKFGAKSEQTMRSNGGMSRKTSTTMTRAKRARRDGGGLGSLNDLNTNEPTNLLDSKQMVQMSARGVSGRGDGDSDDDMEFKTSKDGKMIIKTDRYEKRPHDSDSEEAMDDGATMRSRSTLRSRGGKSKASTHMTNRTGASSLKSTRGKKGSKSRVIGGDKFQSKKGAGGDVKGTSKLEPFAYWPLDRKMLNRRAAKRKVAKKELLGVVKSKSTKLKGRR